MKILQIAKFPPTSPGGIEKVARQISEKLSVDGSRVDIICFNDKNKPSEIEIMNNYTVYKSRNMINMVGAPFSFQNIFLFLKIFRNYDCFHIILPNPLAALYGILLPSKYKISIHYQAVSSSKRFYRLYKILEKILLFKASSIIASTENLANSDVLSPYKSKIKVIPNCLYEKDYIIPNSYELNKKIQKLGNQKYIICLGRFTKYKNIPMLIEAFKKVHFKYKNLQLYLVGSGKEQENIIENLKINLLSDNVKILNSINDLEKKYLLHNALMTVLPSTNPLESFGIVQIESMAMGTPVICFDIPNSGVGSLNINMSTGLVIKQSKDNCESLKMAISKLLEDKSLLEKMGKKSIKRSKEFLLNTHVFALNNYFKKIIYSS